MSKSSVNSRKLLKSYHKGERDFKEANLIKAELKGADLSYVELVYANLSYANLNEVNFASAILSQADLSRANLSRANLSRARLNDASLIKANLSYANLSQTLLLRTDLRWANLSHASLSGAKLLDASLIKADLSYANLSRAKLWGTDLKWAKLEGATLHKLSQARIGQVDRHIDLKWANLNGADLSGADLSGADLSWANLSDANLTGANLDGADLQKAQFNAATKWPIGFDHHECGVVHVDDDQMQSATEGVNTTLAALRSLLVGAVPSLRIWLEVCVLVRQSGTVGETYANEHLINWPAPWNQARLQGDGTDLSLTDLSKAQLAHLDLSYTNLSHEAVAAFGPHFERSRGRFHARTAGTDVFLTLDLLDDEATLNHIDHLGLFELALHLAQFSAVKLRVGVSMRYCAPTPQDREHSA